MRELLWAAILLVAASGTGPGSVCAAEDPTPGMGRMRIGVKLYNFAHAPEGVLREAQRKAADVLREAGIESEWYPCPLAPEEMAGAEACNAALGPSNLVLKLVPNTMAEQFYASKHSLGFALLSDRGRPTSDAWVFYERVLEQADDGGCFVPALLGYAMAHEIGHLLLGDAGHPSAGIMKGFWGQKDLRRAERGELGFSDRQARRMRAQIGERVELGRVGRPTP